MTPQDSSIRRALLLLRGLDAESRSAMLDRLPAAVRCQLIAADQEAEWREEDGQESVGVAREFCENLRGLRAQRAKAVEPPDDRPALDPPRRNAEFDRLLEHAPREALHHLVSQEHPQTVAVIVAHLSPDHAASLLRLTTAPRRAEILQRVIDLEELDVVAIDDIRNHLVDVFARHAEVQQKSQVRMSRVRALLGVADARLKAEIKALLNRFEDHVTPTHEVMDESVLRDEPDAASTSVRFDRIVDIPDPVVHKLFRSIPADVAAVALIGASQPARKDLLQRLPSDLRHAIDAQLSRLGPIRVADIQLAQQIVLSLIEKLLNQSDMPHDAPFTLSA